MDVTVQLGYKDDQWFIDNPTYVLKPGQHVWNKQTGKHKIGDDSGTELQNLAWLYSSLIDPANFVEKTFTDMNGSTWNILYIAPEIQEISFYDVVTGINKKIQIVNIPGFNGINIVIENTVTGSFFQQLITDEQVLFQYDGAVTPLIWYRSNPRGDSLLESYTAKNYQSSDPLATVMSMDGTTGAAMGNTGILIADLIVSAMKGIPNGVATLDGGGKIPYSQLPANVLEYKGTWNASTNTPTLSDASGTAGWFYINKTAGTQNLGSGSITFAVNDWVIYNGTAWEAVVNSNAVISVNSKTGVISLTTSDIPEGTNLYFTQARARGAVSGNGPIQYNSSTGVFSLTIDGIPTASSTNPATSGSIFTALAGKANVGDPEDQKGLFNFTVYNLPSGSGNINVDEVAQVISIPAGTLKSGAMFETAVLYDRTSSANQTSIKTWISSVSFTPGSGNNVTASGNTILLQTSTATSGTSSGTITKKVFCVDNTTLRAFAPSSSTNGDGSSGGAVSSITIPSLTGQLYLIVTVRRVNQTDAMNIHNTIITQVR